MDLISDRIRKNMPVGFRLGSGTARIQAWPASLKLGGGHLITWNGPMMGHLNSFSASGGGNLNKNFAKNTNARGLSGGGDVEASI